MRSAGHRALVTGGAKGIGLALARRFHAAGNEVVVVGRDQAALDSAAAELQGIETIRADIATVEGTDAVASRAFPVAGIAEPG